MKKIAISILMLFSCMFMHASDCDHLYPNAKVIDIPNAGEVCKSFFVVVYDAKLHHPLFSSETFQPHEKSMTKRVGKFYNNVLNNIDINNYPNGYDRGHLTPAADSINPIQMHDTFDSLNSAPQVPTFNRGSWKELEEHIRSDIHVSTWIVTGLIWSGNPIIPTHYYKVVYTTPITAYIGSNTYHGEVSLIRIDQLEDIIGYKLH